VTVCVPYFNLGTYLPRTLESLAAQTYPQMEVLVIDDGSTDPTSQEVFQVMQQRYPRFRFMTQPNAGIGATRNRGLAEARGPYFIPVDADNILRPDLVEKLVAGIHHRPEVAALTCYFLAFEQDSDLQRGTYRYAYRPTGGPHVLASMRNVYGDATAIYRTEAFRGVGGYETDRGTSFEDWEAFVKLAQAGHAIDVLPEHLFYYRHRAAGFSRVTRPFANQERVLRQFRQMGNLPAVERMALWDALVGFHRRMDELAAQQRSLRYRLANRVYAACRRVPLVTRSFKWMLGV
jgi:glycosyltransferase involved in cell wall biosynthesis